MKKNEFLTLCTLLLFCLTSVAQISNEVLGTSVVETEGTFTTGSSITSGDYNVLIGDGAGSMLTSGLNNTFLGTSAGAQQTYGSDNVFIGRFAGYFNIFGSDNVFIGAEAGRLNTGTDNIFIGTEAGENNTSGADNVFVGEESGTNNTEGDDNVFIGEDAGFNNTTADDNTFVGSNAGRSNITGFRNAFFGSEAGYDNTTGYRNTFVGDSTGIDIGVGRLNTFVGQGAGSATEHANYNTFIGVEAGGDNNRTNTTNSSNRNTYVGTFTGFSNREGEDNVGVGAFANYNQDIDVINITGRWGASTSGIARSRTTFLGAQSYPNNNDVVAIGYQTRVDGSRGIAIGNNSRARQTNSMALGYAVDVNQINTLALGGDLTTNRYSVGIGTVKANLNASLDLADVDKGFLLNRVTTAERTTMETIPASGVALTTTDIGLMVYDTDVKGLFSWDGTMWIAVGSNTDNQELNLTTDVLSISGGVATINLSGYLDNTDAQELSLSGTTLAITGNATTVDLSTLQGPIGLTGPAGLDGTDGVDGVDGAPGLTGAAGTNGTNGTDGAQGLQGLKGDDGDQGEAGPAGSAGPAGPTGPAGDCGLDGNSSVWELSGTANPGLFDLNGPLTTFGAITQVKINYTDAFMVNMGIWLGDAQIGDHVTIRERCVSGNYGIYELTSISGIPGTIQSWGLNFLSGTNTLAMTFATEYIIEYTQIGPSGPQGPPGAPGPIGPIGERGFDGNSSEWQYDASTGTGQFRLFGTAANIQLTVRKTDAYGNDLSNWLLFAQPGDIITIRDKNNPNNVGYFQITSPFVLGSIIFGGPLVIYTTQNLIYIASTPTIDFVSVFPTTLFTLTDDCYIGYVKTGTAGPAGYAGPQGPDGDCGLDGNSSVWVFDTATINGQFDTNSASTTFDLVNDIKINNFDSFGVDMENWILDAQPGDHVTIRERCVFSNYGIYELTSSISGPGQQRLFLNFISGSVLPMTPGTEYIIGYTQIGPTGPVGPRGPDGTDGIDGVDGLAGAPGLPGAAGADGTDGVDGLPGADGTNGADGQDGTGTDNQELGISTNILSISGGSTTVDLAPYLDNTDTQELSLNGTTLAITGNATTVDLSALQDGTGTDSQNLVSAVVDGNNLTIAIENGDPVTVDLSPILSNLETQNANQQSQIDDLLSRVATIESCACGGTLSTPESTATNRNNSILYQNIPNPFNGTTSIKYYIPYNKNNGAIVFSNNSGQIIDNIKLENFGEQELFFNGDSLASGIYYYTLFVDGRKVDSKKMIID